MLRLIRHLLLLALVVAVLASSGCSSFRQTAMPDPGPRLAEPALVRLGSTRVEDMLPLWAAERLGFFDKVGLKVEFVEFDTPRERDAAFRAGEIDGFVGDVVSVTRLWAEGHENRIVAVCLGTKAREGRFGLVSAPGSRIRIAAQLQGVKVATSEGTMEQYTADTLVQRRERDWPTEWRLVEDVRERTRMLTESEINVAVLPDPYLTVAMNEGARLIVSDTAKKDNVSHTVLAFSDDFLARPEGASAVHRLLGAWDRGTSAVNSHPEDFRALLVERANLPLELEERYRMSRFPSHQLPAVEDVDRVLRWMSSNGMLTTAPSYQEITWAPTTDSGLEEVQSP